ncbi:helix-turn-helix domain-containing protein [Luteimonas sp. R10]|uniref:helix-turn-helix domain-containing protein n=1 Tax=Luteimonas sp. R10 TaxID=3108176 RepID=UPI00308BAA18|nr:helix-turn-helix transcriptional regulator [Luteimonas sp. R10]
MPSRPSPAAVPSARSRVGANIRRLRKAEKEKMSQEKLGELAECHRTYVSQLERAKTNISIDRLERFAVVLGVDIVDLLQPPA